MRASQLPSIIAGYPVPACRYDKRTGQIIAANKAASRLFGYSAKGWAQLQLSEFIQKKNETKPGRTFKGLALTKSGKKISVQGYFHSVADKSQKYNLLILHKTRAEDDLEARHSRLDKIVRVSHNEIYLVRDRTLAFAYANTSALKNTGYTLGELTGLYLTDLFSFPDQMALQALLNSLRKDEMDHLKLQLRFTRKNGSHYDADVLIQVLEKDALFLVIVNDISEKLLTEKKLRHIIQEKETLIKEIHHRVKNNLQLISSIIYLKLISLGESDIRNFLEDTRQKIRSIALIHERLLQTEKLDKVEISDYLGKLIHDLQVTYGRENIALEIRQDVHKAMISLDTAIICGLIVNELVTNAIKHAFIGRREGWIEIIFHHRDEPGRSLLVVADNGISLPENILPGSASSFGMQLIDVFVKQLGASIEIIREKGTKFQIYF